MSQQPDKFTADASIMRALREGGTAALPIVIVDDRIFAERESAANFANAMRSSASGGRILG
ncbi:MAG: arsenic metallochaperone ArsD family protein [Pyrinomonadaceae bacterium]|nr:arsenic metallochaperone ArsD family protein [Phycisphaerales bacterium]